MTEPPGITAADFQELGVYAPASPHAAQQLELLEYLVSLGATAEDLIAYHDQLAGLASVLAIRGGRVLTMSEAAAKAGLAEDKLLRISRAAGFPEPGPEDRVVSEQFAVLAAGLAAAEAVFGEEVVLQLVRVMGSSMARVADAMVSAFIVNVDPGLSEEDPVGLRVARANAEAAQLLPSGLMGLDVLLRQHLLAARRSSLDSGAAGGYETRRMCVGFVDLVGSTALAQSMPTRELGGVLSEFERTASDVVTSAGGRVVKLIGDEILYVTEDDATACSIALRLAALFCEHPSVPPVRGGVASGEVMMRDGDVFGGVVNLAARAVKAGAACEVITPAATAAAANLDSEPLGSRQLRGFAEQVELCRLVNPYQPRGASAP